MIHEPLRDIGVNPHRSCLFVRSSYALLPERIKHARLLTQLIQNTLADRWDHATQVDHMSHRPAFGDKRYGVTAQRMTNEHDIVVAMRERRTHHICVDIKTCRAARSRCPVQGGAKPATCMAVD